MNPEAQATISHEYAHHRIQIKTPRSSKVDFPSWRGLHLHGRSQTLDLHPARGQFTPHPSLTSTHINPLTHPPRTQVSQPVWDWSYSDMQQNPFSRDLPPPKHRVLEKQIKLASRPSSVPHLGSKRDMHQLTPDCRPLLHGELPATASSVCSAWHLSRSRRCTICNSVPVIQDRGGRNKAPTTVRLILRLEVPWRCQQSPAE